MDNPLVSVIIPVYNGERFLTAAIQSALDQDYNAFEVIVVDDGSTDCTAQIAQSYKDVRYIYQPNQGHGAARNTGIEASQGELLAFLDADDVWDSRKLSVQVSYLIDHPDIGYVVAGIRNFIEPGVERPSWVTEKMLEDISKGHIASALVVRRTVMDQVGAFDTSYLFADVVDWFLRAGDTGIPMVSLPDVLLYRRVHDANQSYEERAKELEYLMVARMSLRRKRERVTSKDS